MRTRSPLLALVVALPLAMLLAACSTRGPTSQQRTVSAEILRGVNAARASGVTCGTTAKPPVPPLKMHDLLIQAAQAHSDDMLAMNKLTHTGSDGSNPGQRIARTGYQYTTWGENAAMGYPNEAAVVKGWLGSTPHCNSIMSASFTEMGAARAGNYWTLAFATPKPQK